MLIRLLRTYLRPHKGAIVLIVVFQTIQAIANLYLPTLNADIIDDGVLKGDIGYIWRIGALMLLVTLVQALCAIGAVFFGARTAMALGRDVREGMFDQVQTFSMREMGKFGAPSLITRTTNDVQQVQMLVLMTFTFIISAPIMCIGGVIMSLRQDVELSSLLLVAVPVLCIIVAVLIAKMGPLYRAMQKRIDKINLVLREQITGIRVIRAFVRDNHEQKRFAKANRSLTDTAFRTGRLMSLMYPAVMLVMNASSVAVLWFGGERIDAGSMEIGALTAFLTYIMQILMSVMMASMMFVMVPRAAACAERIEEVLDTKTTVKAAAEPVFELPRHGLLEMRSAEFRYPGAEMPVLHEISFSAEPGKTTAIIGATGSGKTTLLNMIPRLTDATGGEVLVDGINIKDIDEHVLWNCIGYVPQRPYLFSGTVASNLRYGKEDATEEEMWHALEIAQAKDFVSAMPHGLDSEIAQGGTNVSGGQRQRLAIARALIRRPDIYLFDDSFSALDFATDARLRAALAPETRGATVVIVAQRVGTIRDADTILVLDDGRIVGKGTHNELMETCETYQEIVYSQMSAEEAA